MNYTEQQAKTIERRVNAAADKLLQLSRENMELAADMGLHIALTKRAAIENVCVNVLPRGCQYLIHETINGEAMLIIARA